MPSREQTISTAKTLYENAQFPGSLNASNAWLGIYQTILWYEPVKWLDYSELPHIIDADKLRPNTPAKKSTWLRPNIWQKRAYSINAYLAQNLSCDPELVSSKVDLLMKQPEYEGLQRQNILGTAFVGLIKHILEKFGSKELSYSTEVDAATIFPGITFPGRSGTPRIDLLVTKYQTPRAIISSKWSLRHDRLNDITNECPIYRAAYERIYRKAHKAPFLYFVITNEFDPARLDKALDDSCIDGVIHVHKPAVVDICKLNGRLENLVDLKDFIASTSTW
jgi:hypothetical protein